MSRFPLPFCLLSSLHSLTRKKGDHRARAHSKISTSFNIVLLLRSRKLKNSNVFYMLNVLNNLVAMFQITCSGFVLESLQYTSTG